MVSLRGTFNVQSSVRRERNRDDEGFTLVELLIVAVILPMIVGSISLGLISVFSLQTSVSGRLGDSGDAQVVSSTYIKDVQSAAMVTTQSSPQCGSGNQLLGLKWNGATTGDPADLTYVSYVSVQNGTSTTYSLFRQICTAGPSSTPTGTTIVATDLSASAASTPATITCAPSASGCDVAASTGWVSSTGVISVTFTVVETQSVIAGTNTPFTFTLTATPRLLNEKSTLSPVPPFAPFTLLSSDSCSALSIGNGSLSINVGSGTGNGVLGVASTCPGTVAIANNGELLASGGIVTADPSLNSVNVGAHPGSYPTNESYSSTITDPFASLPVPADPPTGLSAGSCVQSGSVYTCSPGYYATDPTASMGNGVTINFSPGGTFWFEQGIAFPVSVTVNFATGTYIFDAKTALSSSLSTPPNAIISGTGVLLYIHSGSATFGNNSSINLSGMSLYKSVTIWDAAAIGPTDPLTLGNNGTATYGYGGIYVPNGEVIDSNNGTLSAQFIVCSTASFANGLNVNITSP